MDESKLCQQKYDEIVRKEKMTRDELREQIAEQLRIDCSFWGQPTPTYETMAKSILTIIDKAGWKSPEDKITCPDCGIKYKLKEFIW